MICSYILLLLRLDVKTTKNTLFMKRNLLLLAVIIGCFSLFGCNPLGDDNNGTKPDPDDPDVPEVPEDGSISGSTAPVGIGGSKGDKATLNLAFGAKWEVKSNDEWFSVTPNSGEKGRFKLEIAATEDNPEMSGRVGELAFKCGDIEKSWQIVQLGKKGFIITDQSKEYTSNICEIKVNLNGNTEEFTFEPADIVKDYKVTYSGDFEEIENTGIFSDYRTGELVLKLNNNPSLDEARDIDLTITANTVSDNIKINQPEGKWDNPFYKNSLVLDFTSTGCKFCPNMVDRINEACKEMPDRIIPVGCYTSDMNGQIVWENANYLAKKYDYYDYPTALFNNMGQLGNNPNTGIYMADLTKEAIESYKANSMISAKSELSGRDLKVDVTLLSRTQQIYKLHVWVLENNFKFPQSTTKGEDPNYIHNHIGRYAMTGNEGKEINMNAKTSTTVTLTGTIPDSVNNIDNAYIVIFTMVDGFPHVTGVSHVLYKRFGELVDNAFKMDLNGSIDIRYE